jgi:hypothetical protein
MHDTTADVLCHTCEKLSIGGFVIMDDWNGYPLKIAVEDFFKVHGMALKRKSKASTLCPHVGKRQKR